MTTEQTTSIKKEGLKAGTILAENRKTKNLKIEDVSRRLGIKIDYLKAIEDNRFDLLPSGIYGRNFLKKYANFLKEKHVLLTEEIKRMEQEERSDPFSKRAVDKKHFRLLPRMLRNALLITALGICFLYLAFYARRIASAPKLEISYPSDNLLTTEKSIRVEGLSEEEAELRINGELILNNEDGHFFQEINLKSGLNTITISAKKKYSKENIITRQILVE